MSAEAETADSTDTIFYECPHCSGKIEVNEAVLDQKIDCPECNHPFVPPTPVADPLLGEDEPETTEARLATDEASEIEPEKRSGVVTPAQDEETIKVIHPTVFRRHIFGTLGAAALFALGAWLMIAGLMDEVVYGMATTFSSALAGIAMAAAAVLLFRWWLISKFTTLNLTSERTIYRYGIFNRKTSEVRHDDVRNIKIDQSFKERILRFGDMAISSSGQDEMEIVIDDVPNPSSVADFIRQRQ